MYGMGGSFGGMNYESPASSLAGGIAEGQNIILKGREANDRREQIQYERNRNDRLDAMHQAQIDQAERHYQDTEQREKMTASYRDIVEQEKEISGDSQRLVNDWGGIDAVPPDVKKTMDARLAAVQGRRDAWNDWVGGPVQKAIADKATQTNKDMAAGKPVDPGDAYTALAVSTRNRPEDYVGGPNGEPSPIRQGIDSIHKGMTDNDPQAFSEGLGAVFGNEVNTHLGGLNAAGGTVTSRSFNADRAFVPTRDGSAAHPVITVEADHGDGTTSTMPYAPRTAAGSDHPDNQDLASVTPQKTFDQLGQHGMIDAMVNAHPATRDSILETAKDPPQDAKDWAHWGAARGFRPTPNKWIDQRDDQGNVWNIETDPYGRATGKKEIMIRGSGLTAKEQGPADQREADDMVSAGVVNPATGLPFKSRGEVYGYKLKAGGAAAKPSEPEAKAQGEFAAEHVMSDFGVVKDSVMGTYKWRSDSPEGTPKEKAHKAGDFLSPGDQGALEDKMLQAREAKHGEIYGGGINATQPGAGRSGVPDATGASNRKSSYDFMNDYQKANPTATPAEVLAAAKRMGYAKDESGAAATPPAAAGAATPPPAAAGIGVQRQPSAAVLKAIEDSKEHD